MASDLSDPRGANQCGYLDDDQIGAEQYSDDYGLRVRSGTRNSEKQPYAHPVNQHSIPGGLGTPH